ncbi:MAG TPA: hypothetical protein VG502_13985 [Flexivirga sp.]|uniref:hypothetical protein n=1 Tax=Flexivirga sp. TaxID=1962927 RepID=UPI002B753AB7|nr:hypothetical protein [Flexivirga sp.]HWC23404.1 hypothetical protein [Flexivirga sp.]
MRSLPAKQAAAAALLLTLPLSLAACSSGSSDKSGKATTPASPAATSSNAPATSGDTDGGSSADAGKPSRAQVADGMTKYFVGKGVPRSLVDDVANCVADKGYSQFSDDTLRALKSGKVNQLNPLDSGKLAKVTTTCLAAGKGGGSLPSSVG